MFLHEVRYWVGTPSFSVPYFWCCSRALKEYLFALDVPLELPVVTELDVRPLHGTERYIHGLIGIFQFVSSGSAWKGMGMGWFAPSRILLIPLHDSSNFYLPSVLDL